MDLDAGVLDAASPRDRFLLMLAERVDALEAAMAGFEVDVVQARLTLPAARTAADKQHPQSLAARAEAALGPVADAVRAALGAEGAEGGEAALLCSFADTAQDEVRCVVDRLIPGAQGLFGGLQLGSMLMKEPERVTVRVKLRAKRLLPALQRALSAAFQARGLQLASSWEPGVRGDDSEHARVWARDLSAAPAAAPRTCCASDDVSLGRMMLMALMGQLPAHSSAPAPASPGAQDVGRTPLLALVEGIERVVHAVGQHEA